MSVWATAQGLTLGQEAVVPQRHELTALPALWRRRRRTRAGGIVTIDRGPTQWVGHPNRDGADGPGAGGRLHAGRPGPPVHGGPGRIETRPCRGIGDREILAYVHPHDAGPDLHSLIAGESVRRRGTQRTPQTRPFLSRGPPDVPALRTAIRGHWRGPLGRENSLHWVLDVAFREDACRLRQGHAARHRAMLRRTAHTRLRRNARTKLGMENQRLQAGRNLACREEILGL